MEESGKTIREENPAQPVDQPSSWLCDDDDQPLVEYVHAGDLQAFRIRVGAQYYERFGQNADGGWLYRRVK